MNTRTLLFAFVAIAAAAALWTGCQPGEEADVQTLQVENRSKQPLFI